MSMLVLLRGRKHRNWWPFLPVEPERELGKDRRIMGRRILPSGKPEPIGLMGESHPSLDGTRHTPSRKRRTIKHNKGTDFPGQSVLPKAVLDRRSR